MARRVTRINHGYSHTPTFESWLKMRGRCGNPKVPQYKYYGARGIRVCDAWQNDFTAFLADMGERPKDTTLDRIDTNGHYEPANCRWATKKQQMNNMRSNRVLLVNGAPMTMTQASEAFGIKVGTIWRRLELGWDDQRAATRPLVY